MRAPTIAYVEIPGRPVAKQRARTRNGKFYTPAPTRHFEEAVAWAARATGVSGLKGDLAVSIQIHTKCPLRGDVDNYAKSILDGLVKGGMIADDREIMSLCITKGVAHSGDMTYVSIEYGPEAA